MKFRLLTLALWFLGIICTAQVPQAFRYQAVIRDGNGIPVIDQNISIRFSLLRGSDTGVQIYQEEQSVITNSLGIVSLTIGETNLAEFKKIDWAREPVYLKTEVDIEGGHGYTVIGVSQLTSVPYALYAEKINSKATFEVRDTEGLDADSALFVVKNSDGNTVFAVYNNGAVLYIDEKFKGGRGGFAVSGRTSSKDTLQNIMLITPDSVRFYLKEDAPEKGGRGGFAVSGRTSSKLSPHSDFLRVTADSTRITTRDPEAGFAVLDMTGDGSSYLHIKPENMFIGQESGEKTIGVYNSFFGHQTGYNNTTGAQNAFIGYQAGYTNTIGSSNIFLGPQAGYENTQGAYNVFIGHNSGYSNETGHDNVFVGQRSGFGNTSGNANLFVGQDAGAGNFSGTHNVFLGYETGKLNVSGTRNVYIGTQAGYGDSTGNYNVFIGNEAGFYEKGSNKLYIDNSGTKSDEALVFGDFNSNELRLNAKVGINSNNSGYQLNVAGDINFNGQLFQNSIPYNPGLVKVELSENLSSPYPYTNPSLGIMVYNNGNKQPKGFYYWEGSRWLRIMAAGTPTIAFDSVTNIMGTSAIFHATIPNDGGSQVLSRGFCWSTLDLPTIESQHSIDGTGTGAYSSSVTGLQNFTGYRVRAYALNYAGIAYSQEIQFNTGSVVTLPIINTTPISNLTGTSVQTGGTITNSGGASITSRGVCWNTTGNPTIANFKTTNGTGSGSFSASLSTLSMGTTYYLKAYATNSLGTGYGEEIQFTTPSLPVVSTSPITAVSWETATSGGNITNNGGAEIIERGVYWSSSSSTPGPGDNKTMDGNGAGVYTSLLTGLLENTTYYVRAYAVNSAGISYGESRNFKTGTAPLTDIDGNSYQTIAIGSQIWMIQNLKTTKYNDGTPIPIEPNYSTWFSLKTPAYCWYNNDSASYKKLYGALYNYYTVATNKLCPTNWHVPSDAEWKALEMFIGMSGVQADGTSWRGNDEGNKLKEAGTSHWLSPNAGTNSIGFTALPGGWRSSYTGINFENIYSSSSFRTSTTYDDNNAWCREMGYSKGTIWRGYYGKNSGISVRCIKN
ncbi:MAG: fibrobacter succinogenes major paralogous domain-containing protein [Bacteroidales bacterium]